MTQVQTCDHNCHIIGQITDYGTTNWEWASLSSPSPHPFGKPHINLDI